MLNRLLNWIQTVDGGAKADAILIVGGYLLLSAAGWRYPVVVGGIHLLLAGTETFGLSR